MIPISAHVPGVLAEIAARLKVDLDVVTALHPDAREIADLDPLSTDALARDLQDAS